MSTATAPPPPPPRFLTLFWNSAHRHNLCTVTLLAWLSACDGTIDPKEAAFVRRILAAGGNVEDFDVIFQVAQAARIDDLEVACRYVTTHFTRGQKRLFAQLAITLAAQDGHITVGENYALQFLADLLDIRPRAFSKLFQQVTHRPFPEAGDPSTIEWWQRREAGVQAEPAEGLGADEPQRTTTGSANSCRPSNLQPAQ
jgi:uncharacterized tellurite resistance protein B-like protein